MDASLVVQWFLFKNSEEQSENYSCICSSLLQLTIVILQTEQVSSPSWLAPLLRFFANCYFLAMEFPLSSPISYPTQKAILMLQLPCWLFLNSRNTVPHYGYKAFGQLLKILWCLEQPPPEFLFRGKICAVHTNDDPVTQLFQKNWSSGWRLDLTKFFILLLVDHSVILSHSLPQSIIDHSPSDLLRNSPGNSGTPSPLDDFLQQLHGFTHGKTSSWLLLPNTSSEPSVSPLNFPDSSSIQLLISHCPWSWLLGSPLELVYNPSAQDATSHPTAGPWIHLLNSPVNDPFILSP